VAKGDEDEDDEEEVADNTRSADRADKRVVR
jgi:hypothetical protein